MKRVLILIMLALMTASAWGGVKKTDHNPLYQDSVRVGGSNVWLRAMSTDSGLIITGYLKVDSILGTSRFVTIYWDTLADLSLLTYDTTGMGAGGGGHLAFDDSLGNRIWLDTLAAAAAGGLDSAEVMQVIRDTTYVDSALVGQIAKDSTTTGGMDSAEVMTVVRDSLSTNGIDKIVVDTIGSGTPVLEVYADSLFTTQPVYKQVNHLDSAFVTKGTAASLATGGLDSAEIMTVIRDTTYIDSALVAQVAIDSLGAHLDSAEVMTIVRDTTYADSALVAAIARDSLAQQLDSAEIMTIIRDTTYVDSGLVATIARDSIANQLDSAEVMTILRDTTYIDSALTAQVARDSIGSGGLDSAEIMTVIRDTTYADSALVAQIARDSVTVAGLDSAEVMVVVRDSLSTNGIDKIVVDTIGSGTPVLEVYEDSLFTTQPIYKQVNHLDSAFVTKGTATSLAAGGLDSAEVMTVIRDTTYADSALVATIARDSIANQLDSAEVMVILRDTTYADSALVATIARDSIANQLDSAEVMAILRDTTYVDSALVATIARDSIANQLDSAEVMAIVRDTTYIDSSLVGTVVRDTGAIIYGTIAGETWTGVHDFGGATSLEVPNGAAPTVNAAGEIGQCTDSADALVFYDGVVAVRKPSWESIQFTTIDPQNLVDSLFQVFHFDSGYAPRGATITRIAMNSESGTTAIGRLYVDDNAGASSLTLLDTLYLNTAPRVRVDSANIQVNAITQGDFIFFAFASGTPDYLSVEIWYYLKE